MSPPSTLWHQPSQLQLSTLALSRGTQHWFYDFSVCAGQLQILMGESGAGKSTLLDCIAGFFPQDSGDILFQGQSLSQQAVNQRPVSSLFQSHNLFEHISVEMNLRLGFTQAKPDKASWEAVLEACELLQVDPLLSRQPGELSGGQRQRISLIRSVLRPQPILLLDEPFSGLDAKMHQKAGDWLSAQIKQRQQCVLLVSHDPLDAERWGDGVIQVQPLE